MIKINLLPVKDKRRKNAGNKQILLILIIVLIQGTALYGMYDYRAAEFRERQSANMDLRRQIESLKSEVGNLDQLRQEKEGLEKQERILESLESARVGPVRVLDELSLMLTFAVEQDDRDSLILRGVNPDWDGRRVWITSFVEQERVARLLGGGRSNDDVAEFVDRLIKSPFFADVRLVYTRRQSMAKPKVDYVQFEVQCRVLYTGDPNEQIPSSQSAKRK